MAKLTGLGMQRVVVVCFVGVETKFHSTKNLFLFNLHLIAVGPRSDGSLTSMAFQDLGTLLDTAFSAFLRN